MPKGKDEGENGEVSLDAVHDVAAHMQQTVTRLYRALEGHHDGEDVATGSLHNGTDDEGPDNVIPYKPRSDDSGRGSEDRRDQDMARRRASDQDEG